MDEEIEVEERDPALTPSPTQNHIPPIHYYWKATEVVPPFKKFITFHSFMMTYYKKLWDDILLSSENGKTKYFIKVPQQETFPKPVICGSTTLTGGSSMLK